MRTTAEADRHPTGAVSTRLRVLRALREVPGGLSVHILATELGVHPNTVRFHLDRLKQDGLVEDAVEHPSSRGRPPMRFTAAAVPSTLGERRDFRELADVLASVLTDLVPGSSKLTEQAGVDWARRLLDAWTGPAPDASESIDILVDVLRSIGFDPEITSDHSQISLVQRHCPFLEVAKAHRGVVCSVQLGLIRGVLERLGAPIEVTRLVPFATPQGCSVLFTTR